MSDTLSDRKPGDRITITLTSGDRLSATIERSVETELDGKRRLVTSIGTVRWHGAECTFCSFWRRPAPGEHLTAVDVRSVEPG